MTDIRTPESRIILRVALIAGAVAALVILVCFSINCLVLAKVSATCGSYEDPAKANKNFGDLLQLLTVTGGFGSKAAVDSFAQKYAKTDDEDHNFEQFCLRKQLDLCKRFNVPEENAWQSLGLSILLEHADSPAADQNAKRELAEAQDALSQALVADANSGGKEQFDILKNLGWCKVLRKEYHCAIADLEKALVLKPSNDDATTVHELIALCYRSLNREQDALMQYKEIVKKSPSFSAYKCIGDCEQAQAHFAEARSSYEEARKLATKNSQKQHIKILIDQTFIKEAQTEALQKIDRARAQRLVPR